MKLVLRIILLLLVVYHSDGYSQCGISTPIPLEDLDTTSVSLLISGAQNNDLSAPDQGVCAVNVSMRHTFIGDLFVELVSPAGERVRLMGPAVDVSANTSFVTWNVQFNACAFPVFPDGGYDEVWDNLQTWLGGTTYVGTYYPFEGCLEDLNAGPVDGEWSLEFIDQSQFGIGDFLSFEIFFCNTSGITCNACDPGQHQLAGGTADYCQFDPSLVLDLPPSFSGQQPDSELYDYSYAIIQNDQIVDLTAQVDLTNADGGTYTVYGLSYQNADSVDVFQLTTPIPLDQLPTIVQSEDICLSLSTECITLTIAPAPPLVIVEEEICAGDSIFVDGVYYSVSGTYPIINDSNGCDSISRLILEVLENPYTLVAGADTLTCAQPSTTITAIGLPTVESIRWTTVDGRIGGVDTLATVTVERSGTYVAEISRGECIYSTSIVIAASADYLDVQTPLEVITCLDPEVILSPIVSGAAVDSIVWTSSLPFDDDGASITVTSAGAYTATIYTASCIATRTVQVQSDTDVPVFGTVTDTLSCTDEVGDLAVIPSVQQEYTYAWYEGTIFVNADSVLTTTVPGMYSQIVTAPNGCRDTIDLEIIEYSEILSLSLLFEPLTCSQPSTTLAFITDIPVENITNVVWTDPSLTTIVSDELTVDVPGIYGLSIMSLGGCSLDTIVEVTADYEPRNIAIGEATFGCNVDSVRLQLSGALGVDTIRWSGPSFSSTEEDPWIQQPGTYTVEVFAANGCIAFDTVVVETSTTLPDLTFTYGELDCLADSVIIYPDNLGTYTYDWTLLDQSTVSADSLVVTEPGVYRVRVTDGANDCYSIAFVTVIENKESALDSIDASPITCTETNSQVTITSSIGIETYQWADTDGPIPSTSSEAVFSAVGQYFIEYTLANGCTGQDSVEVIALQEVPSIEVTDDLIDCNNTIASSVATITNASNYEVIWTAPDNSTLVGDSIEVVMPGVYQAVVVAEGECRDTAFATIVDDTVQPLVLITSEGNISCLSSTIKVFAEFFDPTVDLLWNGPDVQLISPDTIVVSTPGLYTVTATAQNGCSTGIGIEVLSEVVVPEYTLQSGTLTCAATEVTIEVVPAVADYTIVWADPSLSEFSESVSEPGTYVFSISNPEGCVVEDSIQVLQDVGVPAPTVTQSNPLNCAFAEATLTVGNTSTSDTYMWTGPGVSGNTATTVSIDQAGVYTLVVTAETGCRDTTVLDIVFDLTIPDLLIQGDPITCDAGKSILTASSGLDIAQYAWTGPNNYQADGQQTVVFEEGLYFIEVVASNGCTAIDSVIIEDLQVFPDMEVTDYYLRCDGAELSIQPATVTPSSIVRWFGPNGLFIAAPTLNTNIGGQYIGVAFSEEGCATSDTFLVLDEIILPIFDANMPDLLTCYGPVLLEASATDDDSTVVWIGPNNTVLTGSSIQVEDPGEYELIVMGTNACADTVQVQVADGRSEPVASIEQVTPFQCLTESVLLRGRGTGAIGSIAFEWSTADGTIVSAATNEDLDVIGGGTYSLSIIDESTGCTDSTSYLLVQDEQSFRNFEIDIQPPSCLDFANASIDFTAFEGGFAPYEVVVDDNVYGPTSEVLYLYAGEYLVVVTDSLGCEVSQLITIPEGDYPSVTLPADTIIAIGDSVLVEAVITPEGEDLIIEWNTAPPCEACMSFWIQPFADQYYEVTVSNEAGCSSTADMLISVNDRDVQRLPNVFSPNGDNINDRFYMPYEKGIDNILYFRIYDWNGALIYSANDISAGDESSGWDGTFKGREALQGVYIYQVGIQLISGETIPLVGDVTLVK